MNSPCLLHLAIVVLLLAGTTRSSFADKIVFPRDYAPTDALVPDAEKPARDAISLNGTWQFQPQTLPPGYDHALGHPPEMALPAQDAWDQTPIKIPSPWNVNRFKFTQGRGPDFRTYPSYPEAWNAIAEAWMRRSFQVPAGWKGRTILLRFEAVMGNARVLVNGREAGRHFDNYLPVEFDVTKLIKFGAANEILVGVQSASLYEVPGRYGWQNYVRGSFWSSPAVSGIWQDVSLEAVPQVRVDHVFVQPDVAGDRLKLDVRLKNDTDAPASVSLGGVVHPWKNLAGKDLLDAPEPKWTLDGTTSLSFPADSVTVPAHGSITKSMSQPTKGALALWSPQTPNLYGLFVSLHGGGAQDTKYVRFGWRQFTIEGKTVLLNGKPIVFHGDAAHFMGIPSMSRRYAWAWYTAVKGANGNCVRLHALPYPSFYLDVADEMGMCVLDETGIWGSGGGPKLDSDVFWDAAHRHLRDLVLRDRNHACVMGYSIMNEVFAFADGVYHSPPDLMPGLKKQYGEMAGIVRENDPTHPWISADGDHNGMGQLHVWMIHYIGEDWMKKLSAGHEPWGDGENSGAYSEGPEQAARYAGQRAYESLDGRIEGVASEAYDILKMDAKYKSNYRSIFNILWYALKPLPLGLADTSKPVTLDDGIFFGPYVENKPGVQPERIGPYSMTVNPGLDPHLPLYETYPLYDAIKAGFADPIQPSKWDRPIQPPLQLLPSVTTPANPARGIAVLAGDGGELASKLARQGVTTDTQPNPQLIFVDGKMPPAASRKSAIDACLRRGGTVFVWGVSDASLPALNALLPAPLAVNTRQASSLLPVESDPATAGLRPSDLYFANLDPSNILDGGLEGPLVAQGKVLLKASDTNWKLWDPSDAETEVAQLLRSEREAKPPGAALVVVPVGSGKLYLCNIPCSGSIEKRRILTQHLLVNLGVPLHPPKEDMAALNEDAQVTQALVCGTFSVPSVEKGLAADLVDPAKGTDFHAGANAAQGMKWQVLQADGTRFDFRKPNFPGPKEKAAVYLSFWLWSPRDLTNLLVEPNIPKLGLVTESGDASRVWVNGKPVAQSRTKTGSLAPNLPLTKGWNHILVKDVHDLDHRWQFEISFECDQPAYLNQVRSALEKPASN